MSNPYNQQKQEAKYLTYEHAFNSLDENENPYEKDSDPELFHVWNQGFRANKNRPKPVAPAEPRSVPTMAAPPAVFDNPNVSQNVSINLETIPTELLLAEVNKRLKAFETTLAQMKKVFG